MVLVIHVNLFAGYSDFPYCQLVDYYGILDKNVDIYYIILYIGSNKNTPIELLLSISNFAPAKSAVENGLFGSSHGSNQLFTQQPAHTCSLYCSYVLCSSRVVYYSLTLKLSAHPMVCVDCNVDAQRRILQYF